LQAVLVVAVVVFVMGSRLAGRPLRARSLVVIPAALTIAGLAQLPHLGAAAIAVLVVEVAFGFGLGALRGVTVSVYEKAGHAWFRYRPSTVAIWVVTIAARVAMVFGTRVVDVGLVGTGPILLSLGLSLFGEAAVVAVKAQRMNVPFAPDRRTARATW
jgi:hypothetical protein